MHTVYNKNSIKKSIENVIQCRLQKVLASVHCYGCEIDNDDPLSLCLYFEGRKTYFLHIRGGSDGSSIYLDKTPPKIYDMSEYGKVAIQNFSDYLPFRLFIKKALNLAWLILDLDDMERVVGIRFDFSTSKDLIIANWDDQFYIGSKYPSDFYPVKEILVPNEELKSMTPGLKIQGLEGKPSSPDLGSADSSDID